MERRHPFPCKAGGSHVRVVAIERRLPYMGATYFVEMDHASFSLFCDHAQTNFFLIWRLPQTRQLLPCLALALFGSCLIRQLLNPVTVLLGWGHRDMLLLMPVTPSL